LESDQRIVRPGQPIVSGALTIMPPKEHRTLIVRCPPGLPVKAADALIDRRFTVLFVQDRAHRGFVRYHWVAGWDWPDLWLLDYRRGCSSGWQAAAAQVVEGRLTPVERSLFRVRSMPHETAARIHPKLQPSRWNWGFEV
jgi:hypothetical protein